MKFLFLIFFPLFIFAEEAPEPEYPYPKTVKENMSIEKPARIDDRGTYYYQKSGPRKAQTIEGVEKPYKVGPDGTYFYKSEKRPEGNTINGVESPKSRGDDGSYYYDPDKTTKKTKIHGEQPDRIKSDGTFIYNQKEIAAKNTLSIRGGVYGPPNIKPVAEGGRSFQDIYSDKSSFVLNVEYDWPVFSTFYLKLGSGITTANGTGQFAGNSNPGIEPKETYQFYTFPTTLSLSYKFKVLDAQYLTPYIDAGAGYFGFVETRSDGQNTRFGGAPVLAFTGGLLISLKSFMSGSDLQNDYGIRETWLDIQLRQIVGLDARKDFSSTMITGGFAIGFE